MATLSFIPEVAGDMADLAIPDLSRRQIVGAGKVLREEINDSPESIAEAQEVFRVANVWRSAHQLPMRHMRMTMTGIMYRRGGIPGLTAGRLKRMKSIRAKLAAGKTDLLSMQDLGGCRAIVDTIDNARILCAQLPEAFRHELKRTTDYITNPKPDGYRCSHLIFRYEGVGEFAALNAKPLLIEVQVRTHLQHAWATAVETVDAFAGETLKAGSGDPRWRRFFALASAEMAEHANMPGVPNTPSDRADRIAELEQLDAELTAVDSLDQLRKAVRAVTGIQQRSSAAYIVSLNAAERTVDVTPISAGGSSADYRLAERSTKRNSVLVEIDRAEDLRSAYPNYYLDAGAFVDFMRAQIHSGRQGWTAPTGLKHMLERGSWRKRGKAKDR